MGMTEDIMEIKREQASIRADLSRLAVSIKDLSETVKAGQEKQERLFLSIHPQESTADQIEALGKAVADTKGITARLESRLGSIEKSLKALPSSFPKPSGEKDAESRVGKINTLQFICGVVICLVVLGSSWWFAGHGATYRTLADVKESLNMVHYNQTYGTQYSPWDYNEFVNAWNNQARYIKDRKR